jgi:hypothetical protein
VAVGQRSDPYLYVLLVAPAYALMLPVIAVLHVRFTSVRQSGAILATISGAAVATVGISGAVNVDARPAALFVLGIWWWTIGKMAAETGVLPKRFGLLTAGLGALAFVLVLVETVMPVDPIRWSDAAHVVLGLWLLGLAAVLARPA